MVDAAGAEADGARMPLVWRSSRRVWSRRTNNVGFAHAPARRRVSYVWSYYAVQSGSYLSGILGALVQFQIADCRLQIGLNAYQCDRHILQAQKTRLELH